MKIPAFITVRTKSTRLPSKCLLPFGEGNVLEHIIARALHFELQPIVCTTTDSTDDILEEIVLKKGIQYFRGSENNKLKRWLDCCDTLGYDRFHTVDADDPFFDGELIKKSFALLNEGYDVVYPTDSSKNGGASVGFSLTRDIINNACIGLNENQDTEMMWYYLEKLHDLKAIALPEQSLNSNQVRLTLDYEEDYWLLMTVQRILGNFVSRDRVDDLFRRNPDLYKINWFRNVEWREGQITKKI